MSRRSRPKAACRSGRSAAPRRGGARRVGKLPTRRATPHVRRTLVGRPLRSRRARGPRGTRTSGAAASGAKPEPTRGSTHTGHGAPRQVRAVPLRPSDETADAPADGTTLRWDTPPAACNADGQTESARSEHQHLRRTWDARREGSPRRSIWDDEQHGKARLDDGIAD
jgi:hypothetical protein